MRIGLACTALVLATLSTTAPISRDPHRPIALSALVPAADPLHAHALQFDARFAQTAVEYLGSADEAHIPVLGRLPATAHLLGHARQFEYDVPKASGEALVRELLARVAGRSEAIRDSVAYFVGPLLDDPHWIGDVLRYLPADFRFHGDLFLIAGYDIGVAFAPHASLNAAHRHFEGHSRELLYYAIHELHHVGFMTYSPPPRLSDLKTCADVLQLVEYSTALEGTAVLAALDRRTRERALADDDDYSALGDEQRMEQDEARYFQEYDALKRRGLEVADAEALAVIERMSGGERLWYRVGARMAARVERTLGRSALITLITSRPTQLVSTYRQSSR
jgi:hypothetical protein